MLTFLKAFLHNSWDLVAEMAPYLLFGFAVAGALHIFIDKNLVYRWLGKPGLGSVIKASLIGAPMPLCSCSVIPVAASLRKSGATRGATASFLSSTPQTGVDSILATCALLGGLFALIRVFVALVCGIVTGYLIELLGKQTKKKEPRMLIYRQVNRATFSIANPASSYVRHTTKNCCSSDSPNRSLIEAMRYGFISLPASLARSLIFGLLLAGLITTLMPENLLQGIWSDGPLAFLLATTISLPLYVCATASIPMAYTLMAAGLSPGAALVFLITGPATNTATIVTVWQMLGRRAAIIYLTSLLVISWLSGWLFNTALSKNQKTQDLHQHQCFEISYWEHGAGLLLITLLLYSIWHSKK